MKRRGSCTAAFLAAAFAPSMFAASIHTSRFQIKGDWCFVKKTDAATERAVVLLHGNGEIVAANGSTWEIRADENGLIELLTGAGFIVAQSNAAAIPGNGMWGNSATERAVSALMRHLRRVEHAARFDAIAISAGNLTLLNLMLGGVSFDHVVMLAPVTSLESLYRCPAGVDRVGQISRAFGFAPASGCPGNPEKDPGFRRTTADLDPGRAGPLTRRRLRVLRKARWMAFYEEYDPKVPPPENILLWKATLDGIRAKFTARPLKGGREHTSPALFVQVASELLSFLHTAPLP